VKCRAPWDGVGIVQAFLGGEGLGRIRTEQPRTQRHRDGRGPPADAQKKVPSGDSHPREAANNRTKHQTKKKNPKVPTEKRSRREERKGKDGDACLQLLFKKNIHSRGRALRRCLRRKDSESNRLIKKGTKRFHYGEGLDYQIKKTRVSEERLPMFARSTDADMETE